MSAEKKAAEAVRTLLTKPVPKTDDDLGDDFFDPWDLFTALYGSYDEAFDWMAIGVLCDLVDGGWSDRQDLASNMFREMLCTANLCDYGTSPRGCFPTQEFRAVLPQLVEAWRGSAAARWDNEHFFFELDKAD